MSFPRPLGFSGVPIRTIFRWIGPSLLGVSALCVAATGCGTGADGDAAAETCVPEAGKVLRVCDPPIRCDF